MSRTYERREALRHGHPEWVVKFAYSPAARRCVALLMRQSPMHYSDLASAAGYAPHTTTIVLNALKRIGQVDRVRRGEWRIKR